MMVRSWRGDVVDDAGHKNQCEMLRSVTDGRIPLPAAQTGLTLRGLTTAWRSLLVEQRTELTQVLQQTGMFNGHVEKFPLTVCWLALVQRVFKQLKCLRVVSHVP